MEKVVFIVSSKLYQPELANHYVEKDGNWRAFNFFNAEELLLYTGLKPDVIIYGKGEYVFSKEELESISASNPGTVRFYGVQDRLIRMESLSSENTLVLDDIHAYTDVYRGISESLPYQMEKVI